MSGAKREGLLNSFSNHLSFERGLSRNTKLSYSGDIEHYLDYCAQKNEDPLSVKDVFIDGYLWHLKSAEKISARSVYRKMSALKAFYRFLSLENLVKNDPLINLKTPKIESRTPRFLSIEEIKQILNYRPANFHEVRATTMIELFYACGARISELIELRLENINLNQNWILIFGKGSKERVVPLHDAACLRLKNYIDERNKKFQGKSVADNLFLGRDGKKLSRVQTWKDIKQIAKKCGIAREIYPHLLRHTFASHLLQAGADLRSLQEMLGHSSLTTTQIYTHIDKQMIKEKHSKYHPRA